MKKRIIVVISCLALLTLAIVFCYSKKSDLKIYTGNDIKMVIKEDSLTKTNATIIITDNSKQKHTYGEAFIIEKKLKNTWFKLNEKETWWNLIGYEVDENNQIELNHNWNSIYGNLKKGTYRLLKQVGSTNEYIAVEFKINK